MRSKAADAKTKEGEGGETPSDRRTIRRAGLTMSETARGEPSARDALLILLVDEHPGLMGREYEKLMGEKAYSDTSSRLKKLWDSHHVERLQVPGMNGRYGKVWRYYPKGRAPDKAASYERERDDVEDVILGILGRAQGEIMGITEVSKCLPEIKPEWRIAKALDNLRLEGRVKWRQQMTGPGSWKEYWLGDPHERVSRIDSIFDELAAQ